MNTTTMKWFERLVITLSALASLITFVSLPNTPAIGWGWLMLVTGIFALALVAVASFRNRHNNSKRAGNFLFGHVNASSLWLVVRVYLGSMWLQSGLSKLIDAGWTRGGLELKGFWTWATYVQPGPHPQIAFPWYRDLLQSMLIHHTYTWFAWVIALSEFTVGILLILGLFTGLAAFASGSLNMLYLLAGSAGINPIMLILSLFLLMAWKIGGYYGLDRFILPALLARIEHHTANRSKRINAVSVPNISGQALTTALSLDELHGFE